MSGGNGKMVSELLREQKKGCNLEIGLMLTKKSGNFFDAILDYVNNIHIIELNSSFSISPIHILNCIKVMKNFDILHFHSFVFPFYIAGVLSRKPMIYYIHGFPRFRYKTSIITRIKRFVKKNINKIFLKYFCSAVIANSFYTKMKIHEIYKIKEDKIKVIYCGLDFDLIVSTKDKNQIKKDLNIPQEKYIIGCVANFAEDSKRLDRLIKGFEKFRFRESSLLLIVGDNLNSAKRYMSDHINKANHIQFLGFHKNIYDVINLFDVFVLPSQEEPFGLVVLEALALGKPIIVFSNSGGPAEIVAKVDRYLIVNNEAELCIKLEELYMIRKIIDDKMVEFVKNYFSIHKTACAYTSLYNEVKFNFK